MVNPRSDLYETHPGWVIRQAKRPMELQRNQMILDLTRPEVQQFEWDTIKTVLSVPGVSFAKWDANRYVTQPGSSHLPADEQTHLWIDYTRALYDLMAKTANAFPKVELMLCSGGGGRVDYGALRYFHEFWPSDNTDPVRRVAMQWNYSYFFPPIAICSHVSRAGGRPLHFATAVAMSGRFGMDIDVSKFTEDEKQVCRQAIAAYKQWRDVIQLGDLYRIENPHDADRCVSGCVSENGDRAVFFVYQLRDAEPRPIKLRGLEADASYLVQEVHPEPGRATMPWNGKTFTGADLMDKGVESPTDEAVSAAVLGLTRQPVGNSPSLQERSE